MIFHELADDSRDLSYLIYFENKERCRKNVSSAAVVIEYHRQLYFDWKQGT